MTIRHRSPAQEDLNGALLTLSLAGQRPRCGDPVTHDYWLSDDPDERSIAASWCIGCPVLQQCGSSADVAGETFGVWGGRDRTKRPRPQGATPVKQAKFKLNIPGFRAFRTQQAVQDLLLKKAQQVADAAGPGYEARLTGDPNRARAVVVPTTGATVHQTAAHPEHLLRALDAARGDLGVVGRIEVQVTAVGSPSTGSETGSRAGKRSGKITGSGPGRVYVKGYKKKNGTRVKGHWREDTANGASDRGSAARKRASGGGQGFRAN